MKTPQLNLKSGQNLRPVLIAIFMAATAVSSHAQTGPICTDTNTVKFYLPPQTSPGLGYDIRDSRNQIVLADDFLCADPGPITGIHVWGSWNGDQAGSITNFWIGIYSDVPAVTSLSSGIVISNSHPGVLLWSNNFTVGQFTGGIYTNSEEIFYDPMKLAPIGSDTEVWEYCFYPTNPFYQQGTMAAPTNYWLAIYAQVADSNTNIIYGWKSSSEQYNDPAVWGLVAGGLPIGNWQSMTNLQTGQQFDLSMELTTSNSTPAQTQCVETNGVKYIQGPNTDDGYDVWDCNTFPPSVTDGPWLLADDFVCTNTGPISDIHLWGSWLNNQPLTNSLTFWIALFSDQPTNANNPFSHPNILLWSQCFTPGEYAEESVGTGTENFLDPGPPSIIGPEQQIWYYCFNPSPPPIQYGTATAPSNYWLAVYATLPSTSLPYYYGWKTTTNVQHDISVHTVWTLPPCPTNLTGITLGGWTPNYAPSPAAPQPLDLAFKLTTPTNSGINCTVQIICPTPSKTVYCVPGTTWSFDPPVVGPDPCCPGPPSVYLTVVTNTGACSEVYTGTWTVVDCTGVVLGTCVQVVTVEDTNAPIIYCGTNMTVACGSSWSFTPPIAQYVCTGSNAPVDILSSNVVVLSPCSTSNTVVWIATNACSGATSTCTQSVLVVDSNAPILSGCGSNFTVTNGTPWSFSMPTAHYVCSGINTAVGILSSNVIVVSSCSSSNIIVWSATNACSGAVATCTQIVTVVCPPPVSCDTTNGFKYAQGPNLIGGYNVWNSSSFPANVADGPWVLADDFVCTNTGYISDIHLWGSWLNNEAAPGTITFWLALFTDVPAVLNSAGQVLTNSHPGSLVWSQCFMPGQYAEELYSDNAEEIFMDPGPPANLGPDNQVWYYCFFPVNPPIQHGSAINPKTYWLAAYAQMPATNYPNFGWKTTTNVEHDISVHAKWTLGACPTAAGANGFAWTPNYALSTPTNKPVDLAFQITTQTNCPNTFLTIDPDPIAPTNKVVVTWTTGVLQSSTNVIGPYVDVLGATSPFTNSTPPPPLYMFYRVRCN